MAVCLCSGWQLLRDRAALGLGGQWYGLQKGTRAKHANACGARVRNKVRLL